MARKLTTLKQIPLVFMAFLDALTLYGCALGLLLWLRLPLCLGERLALGVVLFGIMKGLEIFLLVLCVGVPEVSMQAGLSVAGLAGISVALLVRQKNSLEVRHLPAVIKAPQSKFYVFAVVVVLLAGASVFVADWFPLVAPDALWYDVRGWLFYSQGTFNADEVIPQYRQYPPLLPLVYAWFHSVGGSHLKIVFPVVYILSTLLLFYRVREITRKERLACLIALLWVTTPYVWWHSLMGILNLLAGTLYAIGGWYWFTWMREWLDPEAHPHKGWVFLSGLGFGAAALTRPEFILYSLPPLLLMITVLSQREETAQDVRQDHLLGFTLGALGLPTLWVAVLVAGVSDVQSTGWGMVALVAVLWLIPGAWGLGWVTGSRRDWALAGLAGVLLFLALVFLGSGTSLSPAGALGMGLFRTGVFHVFFAGTCLLLAVVLTIRWKKLDGASRRLWMLLGLYLLVHGALYTLLPLKSESAAQFFDSPFIYPGDAVNSPDTREYLAWYPLFLLAVACLPKVQRAFDHA